MDITIQTIADALWWVQNGLDNADMTQKDYTKTQKCRDELRGCLDRATQQSVEADAEKPTDKCPECGRQGDERIDECYFFTNRTA